MIKEKGRFPYLFVAFYLLASAFLTQPAPVYAQGWLNFSADTDSDGLPNDVEITGWCNAVGCFQTDPLDSDHDDDGLTDGEEKLFDSNPNDSASPGIYVIYDNSLKTKEYYPWQQYGNKLIARGDAFVPPDPDLIDVEYGFPTNLDAIVVRRGATFYVGGPFSATLQIAKSNPSLTILTPTQDGCTGKWRVSVPSNGTVGKYMLTLGGKSLDLFVIFELPPPSGELTQLGIEKFLYDNDPNKTSDETSIVLYTYRYPGAPPEGVTPPYTIPGDEEIKQGHTYRFRNEQYNRYLLEEYVIDTINGQTSQQSAADALVARVDEETVFRNPRGVARSWRVLHPGSNPRMECTDIAGLLSAFSRTAGIPARPVMVDWRHSTFDHADEVWLNGAWRVYRGYVKFEMASAPDNTHQGCSDSVWPACGTRYRSTRSAWGTGVYRPWHSGGDSNGNVIISAGDDWTGTGRAYRWASWDISRILLTPSILRTQNAKYWVSYGWTQEPQDYGSPYSWPPLPPASPTGVEAVAGDAQVTVSWDAVPGATSYNLYYRAGYSSVNKVNGTQIASVISPYTVTALDNGTLHAFAVTAVGPTGESPTSAVVIATPVAPPPPPTGVEAVAGDAQVTVSWNAVAGATSYNLYYREGSTVEKGNGIPHFGVTSPYIVGDLTNGTQYAFALASVGPTGEGALSAVVTAIPTATLSGTRITRASEPGALSAESTGPGSQAAPIQLGDVVAEYGVDLNGNDQYDQLVIEVQVTAIGPGDYWLLGELSANLPRSQSQSQSSPLLLSGGLIANALTPAHLVAGSQTVKLVFGGPSISLRRANGPYTLGSVRITDVKDPGPDDFNNNSLDYRDYAYSTSAYQATDFETYGALLSGNYSYHDLDSDRDGRPDALEVKTGIKVYQPGTYTVQGSLYDNQDKFITSATWTGAGPDVTLRFDNLAGTLGPYTLRDLDLLNAEGQSIDYIPEAYTIEPISALASPELISLDIYPVGEDLIALGETITPTQVFTESLVAGNLQVQAEVQVSEAGSYKLEAWLTDADSNLVTWAIGQPADLSVGTQVLSVTFDGSAIRAHGVDGPYTVVALKVLDGDADYEVLDEVDVALTTQAYTLDQFPTTVSAVSVVFEDDMESGSSQWTADSPWNITEDTCRSPSRSWADSPGLDTDYGNNVDVSLTTVSIDVPKLTGPTVMFQGCYALEANDHGYVEISVNDEAWTRVLTYTDGTRLWYSEGAKLNNTDVIMSLKARFYLSSDDSDTADGWYIDDVIITGDLDADDDGIPTADEYTDGTSPLCIPNDPTSPPDMDKDQDGVLNCEDNDADGDNVDNYLDKDSDGDGISDWEEAGCTAPGVGCPDTPRDTDGDGVPDWLDEDSDGDGQLDRGGIYLPTIFKRG